MKGFLIMDAAWPLGGILPTTLKVDVFLSPFCVLGVPGLLSPGMATEGDLAHCSDHGRSELPLNPSAKETQPDTTPPKTPGKPNADPCVLVRSASVQEAEGTCAKPSELCASASPFGTRGQRYPLCSRPGAALQSATRGVLGTTLSWCGAACPRATVPPRLREEPSSPPCCWLATLAVPWLGDTSFQSPRGLLLMSLSSHGVPLLRRSQVTLDLGSPYRSQRTYMCRDPVSK